MQNLRTAKDGPGQGNRMNSDAALRMRRMAMDSSFNGRLPIAQRILRRLFRGAQGTVRVDDFDGDLTIDLRLSEHMQSRIFWVGYYSREIVLVMNKLLRKGMVFVDVGANIGEITMVAAKRVGSDGLVLSFEPVGRNLSELTKNIHHNALSNVMIVASGLSDREGVTQIYQSCGQGKNDEEHLGLNSIYAGSGDGIAIQSIPLTTLDTFLHENPQERVDFIKIDIEGAELPCLKGAEQTLRRFKPLLIVEVQKTSAAAAGYDQAEILHFLDPLGYRFFRICRRGKLSAMEERDLSDYQNILCVHSSALETIS